MTSPDRTTTPLAVLVIAVAVVTVVLAAAGARPLAVVVVNLVLAGCFVARADSERRAALLPLRAGRRRSRPVNGVR